MSTQPYLLDHLHAGRERQFQQVADRGRAARAIAPSGPARRVLRWRPDDPFGWARRFASAVALAPATAGGLHR